MTKLDQIVERQGNEKSKRIAVAVAEDADVMSAVHDAVERGIAEAVLVGDAKKIKAIIAKNDFALAQCEIIDEADHKSAAEAAVRLVKTGDAQVLMKGSLHTAILMHAILDREKGIRAGGLLSHVGIIDSPMLNRLIFLSDPGMVALPTLKQKIDIINNAVPIARGLGVQEPKVACISAVEVVNPEIPSTMDAAILAVMSQRGQFKNCLVDGPLALDNAINPEAAKHKGVKSPSLVVGNADILIVPNIETGNAILKASRNLGGCSTAGVLAGATAPVVMSSRADSAINKLRSIACAIAAAN